MPFCFNSRYCEELLTHCETLIAKWRALISSQRDLWSTQESRNKMYWMYSTSGFDTSLCNWWWKGVHGDSDMHRNHGWNSLCFISVFTKERLLGDCQQKIKTYTIRQILLYCIKIIEKWECYHERKMLDPIFMYSTSVF